MNITAAQTKALKTLAAANYEIAINKRVGDALVKKGLATCTSGMSATRTTYNTRGTAGRVTRYADAAYRITAAGRAAIA